MGCGCNSRCVFLSVCIVQLVTVCVRQVFDFLGFQWTSVIANFCQIAVLILALFGAYQYKRRIIAVYVTWTLIWTGWNVFIVCLYLNIGVLSLNDDSVTMNLAITDSYSWFRNTTFSCDSMLSTSVGSPVSTTPTDIIVQCAIDFRYIEVFQAGLQIALACFGFVIACYLIGILEDESASFDFIGGDERKRRSGPEESPLVRSDHVAEE